MSDHGPLLVTGEGLYHHLDGTAALMDSIAALCEAVETHDIESVWRGYGWGKEVRCSCGTHVAHRDAHYDHVLDAARELLEEDCA